MITCLVKFSFSASLCQTKARAFWFEEHAGGPACRQAGILIGSFVNVNEKSPRERKICSPEANYSVSARTCQMI
ncbi:MAG: hypothetical protein AAB389_04375, partial [Patescibacteria group bacterium]